MQAWSSAPALLLFLCCAGNWVKCQHPWQKATSSRLLCSAVSCGILAQVKLALLQVVIVGSGLRPRAHTQTFCTYTLWAQPFTFNRKVGTREVEDFFSVSMWMSHDTNVNASWDTCELYACACHDSSTYSHTPSHTLSTAFRIQLRVADPLSKSCLGDPPSNFHKLALGGASWYLCVWGLSVRTALQSLGMTPIRPPRGRSPHHFSVEFFKKRSSPKQNWKIGRGIP